MIPTDLPDLTADSINDDFQRLFIDIVLNHAKRVIEHLDDPADIPPLRLMLLGTAGTGKTTAVQTLLQAMKSILDKHGLGTDFYRVGAYTGCAAFNVRYSASTLHRLFEIFNPFHFADLPEGSTKLHDFQTKMANTHLLIFDEISMIGRQIMGNIDARCDQATSATANPRHHTLGAMSCVGVGDPAQCPPIKDEIYFNKEPHRDSKTDPEASRAQYSHRGLNVYASSDDVIILNQVHRVRQKNQGT